MPENSAKASDKSIRDLIFSFPLPGFLLTVEMLKKQSAIFFPSSATQGHVFSRAAGARDPLRACDPVAVTEDRGLAQAQAEDPARERADRAQTAVDQAQMVEATVFPLSARVLPVAAVALRAAVEAVQGAQALALKAQAARPVAVAAQALHVSPVAQVLSPATWVWRPACPSLLARVCLGAPESD